MWRKWCYQWKRIGIAAGLARDWTAPSFVALDELVKVNEMWLVSGLAGRWNSPS